MSKLSTIDQNLLDQIFSLIDDCGVESEESIPTLARAIVELCRDVDPSLEILDEVIKRIDEECENE